MGPSRRCLRRRRGLLLLLLGQLVSRLLLLVLGWVVVVQHGAGEGRQLSCHVRGVLAAEGLGTGKVSGPPTHPLRHL
jgi:hypothetical protein